MVRTRQGSELQGLRATSFGAVIGWQIYEMATKNVFASGEGGYVNMLIVGGALTGLIASLLKLSTES